MRRPVTFIFLALMAATVAAMVVYSALKKRDAEVQQAMVKSLEIVVAAHDLPVGSKLDPSSIKMVRWSRDDLPPGAITDSTTVLNQYTKAGIVEGEPIVESRLFHGERNAGVLPLLIPAGMRAISVPVDEVGDIAGFVLPHSRVDVLVAVSNGPVGGQPFSKIVLQNVEVLAVAQEIESVEDKPEEVKVVTFLVTPDEVECLSLASHEGTLRLAMRNYDDRKIVPTSGVDVSQMLGAAQPQVALTPTQKVLVHQNVPAITPVNVEVLRNGKSVEEISFVRTHGAAHEPLPAHGNDFGATPAPAGGNAGGTASLAGQKVPLSASLAEPPDDSSVPIRERSGPDKPGPVTELSNGSDASVPGFTGARAKTIVVP
jgi:pilus assembly protein CpaB